MYIMISSVVPKLPSSHLCRDKESSSVDIYKIKRVLGGLGVQQIKLQVAGVCDIIYVNAL